MASDERTTYEPRGADTAPRAPWSGATAYEQWRDRQGIPVYAGFAVDDIRSLTTGAWDRVGGEAAFLDLEGATDSTGQYVLRLERGREGTWRQQAFEEFAYVVQGSGGIEVELGADTVSREWLSGALVPLPLNRRFRLHATEDATLYCVNGAPLAFNLFHSEEYLFDNPFEFRERASEPHEVLSSRGRLWRKPSGNSHVWETNFVEDVGSLALPPRPDRGAAGSILLLQLAECTLTAHVSEFPPASYKKAHRHGPGANVLVLAGAGYSLLWPDRFEDHIRVDWRAHSLLVPPNQWWHQHFNPGPQPARYLAIRWNSPKYPLDHNSEDASLDRRKGGNQIEYDDQHPAVDPLFQEEVARDAAFAARASEGASPALAGRSGSGVSSAEELGGAVGRRANADA